MKIFSLAPRENWILDRIIKEWKEFGKKTAEDKIEGITRYTNEFWTSKQRQGHSIHEVSYRACFKPQLPNFFINTLTKEGDMVYDPFMGRGTTLIEAALLKRNAIGNDIIIPSSESFK